MSGRLPVRIVALALAFGALLGGYALVARPWLHRWGATDAEVRARLPGDEIVPGAKSQETRAITIEAPAWSVWPWVAQIGQDRAGFYSYQVLENLVGCEMPNVQTLVPRLQQWRIGDKLWMYPPRKAGGAGHATLMVYEPGRALGFATRQIGTSPAAPPDASWSFVVQPIGVHASRLIFRGRGAGGLRLLPGVFMSGVFEPVHFAMERRAMTSIKQLAEGGRPSAELDTLQVILWFTVFFGFVFAGVATLVMRRFGRPLASFVLMGVFFQLLTLVQPNPAVGFAVFAVLAAGPWLARGRGAARGAPRSQRVHAQVL
jgi:hypothetical protein